MAREVIWTPRAEADLLHVLAYLDREWGDRVVAAFLADVDEVVQCIGMFPFIFRASGYKAVREALVTKHNLLFYHITEDVIRPAGRSRPGDRHRWRPIPRCALERRITFGTTHTTHPTA